MYTRGELRENSQMIWSMRIGWLVCGAMLFAGGCKKKEEAGAEGSAGSAGSGGIAPAATIAPKPTPTPLVPPPKPMNNDADAAAVRGCCAALRKAADSEKSPVTKGMYSSSASVCDTQAANVKSGSISRGAAISSIRGSMRGKTLPAGCN